MKQHETIREALVDPEGALSLEVEAHLEGCGECRAFAESLASVDAALPELARLEAPEELVARTLARIAKETPAGEADKAAGTEAPRAAIGVVGLLVALAGGIARGLVALASLLVAPLRHRAFRRWSMAGFAVAVPAAAALTVVLSSGARSPRFGSAATVQVSDPTPESTSDSRDRSLEQAEATVMLDGLRQDIGGQDIDGEQLARELPAGSYTVELLRAAENAPTAEDRHIDETLRQQLEALGYAGDSRAQTERRPTNGRFSGDGELDEDDDAENERGREVDLRRPVGGPYALDAPVVASPEPPPPSFQTRVGAGEQRDWWQANRDDGIARGGRISRLLADRSRIEGVRFVDASGHWASTYHPGDPALRLLRARLASSPEALALAEQAERAELALDPPASGALALSLRADRAAVEGPTRMLLSVGVRGAAARAGRRPTLSVEVVIDARRALDDEARARLRALLTGLSHARQGADRIGVIVAGPRGGELVPLGDLRHGELTVALARLAAPAGSDDRAMSLPDAVRSAIESVGQLEDPSSPLGAALVLVVSPALGELDGASLEPLAHAGALAGVTTTALAMDAGAALEPLERVALAGHGRRRVLTSIDDAGALVRSEVEAVSRVVARAVRLRVRLAPGVSLVDVIGSRRLDGDETRRVREAEQAVDRALALRLGITSDRDDDEDGLQIVMPAFYAGDSHVVLLDVVVPGPGPVADVSLRWKDLVRLSNGSATERLALARGARTPGPRERQVLGQLVAHEIAAALRDAARSLDAGDVTGARTHLNEARALVVGTRALVRQPSGEDTAARDLAMFTAYDAALASSSDPRALADSLRYASRRRLEGAPLSIDGSLAERR